MEALLWSSFEWLGIVAFALSGAMIGVKREMDIFGVNLLGVTTAVGGGFIRDVTLGITPPQILLEPSCAIVAILLSTALFVMQYFRVRPLTERAVKRYEKVMLYCDAIGLAVFTVVGIDKAVTMYPDTSWAGALFLGLLTGTGGGVVRDVLAGQTPFILTKHVYACASLAGGTAYYFLLGVLPRSWTTAIAIIVTVTIRGLANHYRWNLPRVRVRP